MVWERPASEVAATLGISDVALGKLCRRLQVPKPPRGYWAKVQAGKRPRRPVLGEFIDPASERGKRRQRRFAESGLSIVRLSRLQLEYLEKALAALKVGGRSELDCVLSYEGIRRVAPEAAAELLILIQNRYERWLDEIENARFRTGAHQSVRGLVAKLLPLAREQVVVFARPQETRRYGDDEAAVIVRLTPRLLQSISRMAEVVREEALGYAVRPLDSADFTYRVRYLLAPDEFGSRLRSDLCVSTSEVSVRTHLPEGWSGIPAETEHVPLGEILPVDALPADVELPAALSEDVIHRYGDRLRALQDEERVYDVLASAAYRLEGAVPSEVLGMVERLWFDEGETPFSHAREASLRIEGRLEAWERALEAEGEKLCREVLGVRVGDTVLTTVRGKTVRIRVNRMHVHGGESGVYFSIYGTRFRKDGTLGKRDDMVVLNVDGPNSRRR